MQTFVDLTGLWILLIAATGIYLAWPKEGEEDGDGYRILGFILIIGALIAMWEFSSSDDCTHDDFYECDS
jgi:hypothetical protein